MISGYSTAEGTSGYAEMRRRQGFPASAYRLLGRTGWTTSVVGFGCYRIEDKTPQYAEALQKALRDGCNLIDTSTNYGDGASEACVGQTLAKLKQEQALKREEVIVVSKVGYVQGHNLELAMERERAKAPFPEMVKYQEGCWHCLHPEFIADQLTRSLSRLQLARVDAYLLHNPEYFFSDAKKRGDSTPLPQLRSQFYERIEHAFRCLEAEVEGGRIGCYGVSSNTFGDPEEDFETTSLCRMLAIARTIAGESHHFSIVQLPANLFESGPWLERNNGGLSALELAIQQGLGVLVNRPLNAQVGNQIVRLADFPEESASESVEGRVKEVASLEEEFIRTLAPHIQAAPHSVPARDFFRWGTELANPELASLPVEHWLQIETQLIRPQLGYLIHQLEHHLSEPHLRIWGKWKGRYLPALEGLLAGLRARCAMQSRKLSQRLTQKLDPFLPENRRPASLSSKTIAVLANTPGVSCVLNGMRHSRYVDDSLGVLRWEPFSVKPELYRAFRPSR